VIGQHDVLLGPIPASSSSGEIFNASRHELDLRHPYRDRRLVEFVLSLPAYQLYRHGLYKHILRVAMKDILPEIIRTRRQPTSMMPLYHRGIENEHDTLKNCFEDPGESWSRFVRSDWLGVNWATLVSPEAKGPGALVPWLCISYETWYKCHANISGIQRGR
jgi:asparagine synthetase B (glutamine-hydrolysing)